MILQSMGTGDSGVTGQTVPWSVEEGHSRNSECVITLHFKSVERVVREEALRTEHVTPSTVQVKHG